MATPTLEERVVQLEKTVAELVGRVDGSPARKNWRSTVGMFANDPVMKEIIEEGRRIREADRQQVES